MLSTHQRSQLTEHMMMRHRDPLRCTSLIMSASPAPIAPSPPICVLAEEYVRAALAGNDASHDWQHIARVRALALSLALEEGLDADSPAREVVEVAALLHDVADWKYSGSETAGVEAARAFLQKHSYDPGRLQLVLYLIEHIGFKSELARIEAASAAAAAASTTDGAAAAASAPAAAAVVPAVPSLPGVDTSLLLGLVQDADRLDAIGAIGIARCFTFGGHKKRPLYDPAIPFRADLTAESYKSASAQSPSINHFYEKLLKLKELMKTKAGKSRALKRHVVMEQFLEQFAEECAGRA